MRYIKLVGILMVLFLKSPFVAAEPPIRPGDHIAIVGNTFADQLRIHGYFETLLLQQTRENAISIRNLGWAGDMLSARDRPTNFPSEEATLIAHRTDVIIACFGMGESFAGQSGLEKFRSDVASFVATHQGKQYNGRSAVRLILVSPIAAENRGKLTANHEQRNRDLQTYSLAMQTVADATGVHFVDLYERSRYLMEESVGPDLTNNGIHLNPFGYWAISRSFVDQLLIDDSADSLQPWQLSIDAVSMNHFTRGVTITELRRKESGIEFVVTETSAPCLPPPTKEKIPTPLEFQRDRLTVENLESGNYLLTVDGIDVVTADANQWSAGVAIDGSPSHLAAEAFRARVNDKNLQFTYSWKALNQVHIVGERRSSPSGKALPSEVIAFDRLARERDEALRTGVPASTRSWKLVRVE